MPNNKEKRKILDNVLGKIKMHDAGIKRNKIEDMPKMASKSRINYPSLYLNVKQAPELKGSDVHDGITLVIKGKVISHSVDENINSDSRETFDIQINKIGIIK